MPRDPMPPDAAAVEAHGNAPPPPIRRRRARAGWLRGAMPLRIGSSPKPDAHFAPLIRLLIDLGYLRPRPGDQPPAAREPAPRAEGC